MNMKKYTLLLALLLVGVLTGYSQQSAYLFVYFTGNRMSEEAIRMAVSPDGYNYYALNGNQPVIDSREISSTGGVRDPHILRCEDGKTFYMVVTDMVSGNGWSSNRAMVLLDVYKRQIYDRHELDALGRRRSNGPFFSLYEGMAICPYYYKSFSGASF